MSNYTPIFAGKKVIGRVCGKTFFKTIRGSVHLLKTPRAIALDVESLNQAEQAGATHVKILDKETQIAYYATIEHIRRAGFPFNRGFGNQIGLVMEGWTITGAGGVFAEQLSLFG